jgi:hypothetical protein
MDIILAQRNANLGSLEVCASEWLLRRNPLSCKTQAAADAR